MAKRVTIMLDEELDKKIRLLQAKKLRTSDGSVSFSKVINECLKKSL